jgi:hypothetical protein
MMPIVLSTNEVQIKSYAYSKSVIGSVTSENSIVVRNKRVIIANHSTETISYQELDLHSIESISGSYHKQYSRALLIISILLTLITTFIGYVLYTAFDNIVGWFPTIVPLGMLLYALAKPQGMAFRLTFLMNHGPHEQHTIAGESGSLLTLNSKSLVRVSIRNADEMISELGAVILDAKEYSTKREKQPE